MGLADTLRDMAQYAIATLGNATELITYRSRTGSVSYNPGGAYGSQFTDTYSDTFNVPAAIGNLLVSEDEKRQDDLRSSARHCFIAATHLGTVVPKVEDRIVRSDGSVWYIKDIETGPGQAGYLLMLVGV